MKIIESTQNEIIKRYAKLSQKKFRDQEGLYLIEGIKNSYDSLAYLSKDEVEAILICKEKVDSFLASYPNYVAQTSCASKEVLKKVSDYTSEAEIIIIAKKREHKLNFDNEQYVFLDGISDPGNLGTIIRTACGAGYGVILSGCCDLYNPKVIRACMSAILTNIIFAVTSDLTDFKSKGYRIIGADAKGRDVFKIENGACDKKLIIAIGSEAQGLSSQTRELCDEFIAIPSSGIESLNAAIAASVLMLEYKYRILI